MNFVIYISYFFGGIFLANAIPHFVSGMMGRAFQSPFAKPSGEGLSSSTVNVMWGFFNVIVAYLLIVQVEEFDLHSIPDVLAVGMGVFPDCPFYSASFWKIPRRQFPCSLTGTLTTAPLLIRPQVRPLSTSPARPTRMCPDPPYEQTPPS